MISLMFSTRNLCWAASATPPESLQGGLAKRVGDVRLTLPAEDARPKSPKLIKSRLRTDGIHDHDDHGLRGYVA